MTSRSAPVPMLAGAILAAGIIAITMWMILRQINSGQQTRCTAAHACVDALDGPYVMRRP